MLDFLQLYVTEIWIGVFATIVMLQVFYYLFLFVRFAFHRKKNVEANTALAISIVIVAKNDAHYLVKTLPVLLTQEYSEYEVIVVNDNSNDETPQVVFDFQNSFKNLKLVNLESSVTNIKGKKFPLSLGIKAATFEHVLLTDADCFPTSNLWISNMARNFDDKTKIVLGFSTIQKKIGLLNAFIRFDKLHQAIQFFSYSLAGIPFMGVGQNLSYTKALFFKNRGFASQNHLRFGDDDLFINQVATAKNCVIEYSKDAFTIARPNPDFKNWFLIKIFQSRTRKLYATSDRILLNLYNFLMPMCYITFGVALFFALSSIYYLIAVTAIFVLKFIIQYIIFGFAATKLDEKRLIPHILFYDIIFSVLSPIFFVASRLKK